MHFDSLQGWLSWQESLHPKVIDLGLDRATQVYMALNPERIKPYTITVAGTNGKGSCIAFLEAIYLAQGYRVGAYTSPHILRYNERIKINGREVSDADICSAFERIESVRNDVSLSYFEFGTLAAVDIFWRSKVDVQLLEVGLGGRLDAVNIIDPDVALVTSICIDHCDWLGETREAIGQEKAGIFRSNIPAIIGDPDPPVSLVNSAEQKQAKAYKVGYDFDYQKSGQSWVWRFKQRELTDLPWPALKGEHQFRNAASVLLAVDLMQENLPVSKQAIQTGIGHVNLKGRYQYMPGEIPVLLDVGHNPQAVRALYDHLLEHFADKTVYAVFSMMKDKDIKGVLEIMQPRVKHWFVSPLLNPRTASLKMMQEAFSSCKITNVSFNFYDFNETFAAAETRAGTGDLIVVFGSFFLVSEYLSAKSG